MKTYVKVLSTTALASMIGIASAGMSNSADAATGEAPTINAPSNQTVEYGGTWNPYEGVSANDAEDGDLTNEVYYDAPYFNGTTPGDYEVTYGVWDSDDNETTTNSNVRVLNQGETSGDTGGQADEVDTPINNDNSDEENTDTSNDDSGEGSTDNSDDDALANPPSNNDDSGEENTDNSNDDVLANPPSNNDNSGEENTDNSNDDALANPPSNNDDSGEESTDNSDDDDALANPPSNNDLVDNGNVDNSDDDDTLANSPSAKQGDTTNQPAENGTPNEGVTKDKDGNVMATPPANPDHSLDHAGYHDNTPVEAKGNNAQAQGTDAQVQGTDAQAQGTDAQVQGKDAQNSNEQAEQLKAVDNTQGNSNVATQSDKSSDKADKKGNTLPDTGEESSNAPLFGGIFTAIAGVIALGLSKFRRKENQ